MKPLKTLKTFHDRTRLEMALISAWKGEPSIAGLKSIMALIRTDWPETEYLPRQKYQEAFIEIAAQLGPSADSTLLNDLLDPDSSCRYAAAAALVKIHSDASNSVHQEAERMLIAILEKHEPSFTLAASELIRIASKPGAALFAKAAAERDFKIIMAGLWWYVEKGIPGSEDVIGDALDRHGNRWDAELLLNCGNFILERRAAEWARQRNYQINSYPSGNLRSGQLRWGMNR